MKTIKHTIFICLFAISFNCLATEYQDMTKISELAHAYLLSQPELSESIDTVVTVNRVDRRLKLPKCQQLEFKLATGANLAGKTSVRVICLQPKSWSFYLTAHISRFDEVYISHNPLRRGQIIKQQDVFKTKKDLSTLPFGYITRAEQIIGKQVKRQLQAGKVITPNQLTKPIAVKRGEMVSLESNRKGFSISMKGIAMGDGSVGDRIRVKNTSSKRIIEGTVIRTGVVSIEN